MATKKDEWVMATKKESSYTKTEVFDVVSRVTELETQVQSLLKRLQKLEDKQKHGH